MENTTVSNVEMDSPRMPLGMNPKKFALWLFIVSITMMFAAMTSAYLVRKGEGNWLEFSLPSQFVFSTVIIVLSSISMQMAYMAAKRDEFNRLKWLMSITFALGVIFCINQIKGWGQLVDQNVYFVGNPAGSFVHVFSGLHGAHLVSGLVFLMIVFFQVMKENVHSRKLNLIQMCNTYWHFLGGLWLYLFGFLWLNH